MRYKLRQLLVLALTFSVLFVGSNQIALAAYGTGEYGACAYQTQTGCDTASTAGAPNTGVQPGPSLLWPIVAGITGFAVVSFVVIRYRHRDKSPA